MEDLRNECIVFITVEALNSQTEFTLTYRGEREIMNVFMSQLKNMSWVYNDLIVDVDGEALTVATLIERYKELKNDIKPMTKPTVKSTTETENKPKRKTRTKTTTEK